MLKIKAVNSLKGRRRKEVLRLLAFCRTYDENRADVSLIREEECIKGVHLFYLGYYKKELVAFLRIYPIDCLDTVEAAGFVLPVMRRKGFFTELFQRMCTEWGRQGLQSVVFIHEPVCREALKALEKMQAEHLRSEYLMVLENAAGSGRQAHAAIAGLWDIKTILPFYMQLFPYSEEDAELRLQEICKGEDTVLYFVLQDEECIGFCSVMKGSDSYCIFDFGVAAGWQGKGYGKVVLGAVVEKLIETKEEDSIKIFLHVSGSNPAAFHLYHNFGFTVQEQYDYYKINI